MMPTHWRFRTNWRGKLILQREVHYMEMDWTGDSYPVNLWRDATMEDLLDFLKANSIDS